ncbi:hypothetical protein HDU91_006391 [Kappamyces sp. JEL0680]|nr:hypothetical protein HDU91_006391 [Kappamyces sp. JEL0680]
MSGKVVLVTGGNSGIGFQTVSQLAKKGAKVYLGARNPKKASDAIEKIKSEMGQDVKVEFLQIDLADIASVKAAAAELKSKESKLDVCINNAGIMAGPFELTKDGIEAQFGTNHVGHFVLTRELLPWLQKAPEPRIVNLSSIAHKFTPSKGILTLEETNTESTMNNWTRYGQSKLANLLFSAGLHKRYGDKIYVNSVHPGYVATELVNNGPAKASGIQGMVINFFSSFAALSPLQGAYTSLYVATSPDIVTKGIKNKYFVPYAAEELPTAQARDEALAEKLWTITEEFLKSKNL